MAASPVRQRSLIPLGEGGPVEGWMDNDVASAATQLFGSGPRELLVVDGRELLTFHEGLLYRAGCVKR
jgi:hypothetical protein